MAQDLFAVLGLTPGRYETAEITRQFETRRSAVLDALDSTRDHERSRADLERLYLAFSQLRDPDGQDAYLQQLENGDVAVDALRRMIGASLEDGLLRYSRRQTILEEGRVRGFSDFQTHLLIAQVQFGDDTFSPANPRTTGMTGRQALTQFAAAVGLGVVLFVLGIWWLQPVV